jgi:hypothetical protein
VCGVCVVVGGGRDGHQLWLCVILSSELGSSVESRVDKDVDRMT